MTEIGEIPKDWHIQSLGSFCRVVAGYGFPLRHQRLVSSGIPFIKVDDMNDPENQRYMRKYSFFVTREILDDIGAQTYPKGTIIFPKIGAALLTNKRRMLSEEACFDNNVMGLVPKDLVKGEFLYYLMLSTKLDKWAQTTSLPSINKAIIESLKFGLPPLPEQQEISSFLSTVDDAIQKVDEIIAKTHKLKKGLMQQLFTRGMGHARFKQTEIGEIPEDWDVVSIDQIKQDDLRNGMFVKNPKWGLGIRFLNVVDTYGDSVVQPSSLQKIDVSPELARSFVLRKGDIVFVRSSLKREGIAQACMIGEIEEQVTYDCHLIRLTPNKEKVDSRYLVEYSRSNFGKRQLISLSKTTTMTTIQQKNLSEFKFPLPPLSEQQRIATILSSVDNKVTGQGRRKHLLEHLKSGLMQVLLTGKVRVHVN